MFKDSNVSQSTYQSILAEDQGSSYYLLFDYSLEVPREDGVRQLRLGRQLVQVFTKRHAKT